MAAEAFFFVHLIFLSDYLVQGLSMIIKEDGGAILMKGSKSPKQDMPLRTREIGTPRAGVFTTAPCVINLACGWCFGKRILFDRQGVVPGAGSFV